MTCDKCGKELEEVEKKLLPCIECDLLNYVLNLNARSKCWGCVDVKCFYCKNMSYAAPKLGAALEIAIETLKEVRAELAYKKSDCIWSKNQINKALEKINEVCK